MNPPNEDYQVEDLDVVLIDRFHVYYKMQAEINTKYLVNEVGIPKELVTSLKEWWEDCLDDNQRKILTPRRVEYLGIMIQKNIPWRDAIPQGHPFPLEELAKRIRQNTTGETDGEISITKEFILGNKDLVAQKIKENPKYAIPASSIIAKFSESEIFECRDVIECMPKELVLNIGKKKFFVRKRKVKELFMENKIDTSAYPKLSESFGFENER